MTSRAHPIVAAKIGPENGRCSLAEWPRPREFVS